MAASVLHGSSSPLEEELKKEKAGLSDPEARCLRMTS